MRMLNPNTEYLKLLNNFELVSDGIQKVKETLDPMFDHYEVLPKKIVGEDKITVVTTLTGAKRDEGLKRVESEINHENLK